jgi:leucyl aminopeptidase
VAGLLKTLALTKSPAHVVGIIGLVENMPDGNAMRPGDVIRTMSGQTIEIVNTDAEGRLVLADCLWYAQKRFKPQTLIDLGTLTPDTFAALAEAYAGLYCNNNKLTQQLKDAGDSTGDLLWELPMGPHFAKQIESPVADMKNMGHEMNGDCGAAAEFLRRFVKCDRWAHLDIAGVSWIKEDLPLCPKGVTGYGVRLLEEWIHKQTLVQ